MDGLRQDLRFALRLLRRDHAFAVTTLLTLALCIGANTGIFAIVRSVLLRPLVPPEADRLVINYDSFPGAGVERVGSSVVTHFDRLPLTDVFDSLALYRFSGLRVGRGETAEGVASMDVTPSFFRVLRARPARGRLFDERDGQPGHNRVALLSHAFAQRQPGGTEGVVGRDLRLNDELYIVVGVLPPEFTFLNPRISVWVPLAFTPEERAEDRRWSQNHDEIARLAEGATLQQAQARIDALNTQLIERAGPLKSALINAGYHTRVVSFEADVVRNVRSALQLLWSGVLFVLLIAAVNITNLSLARATGRLKEFATRHALGAARARVARQLVSETMVLTIAGSALGLVLGVWSLGLLSALGLSDMPRAHEIRIDGVVVAWTIALAVLLGTVVGVVPAMQMAGLNLASLLRDEGRGTAGRRTRYLRGVLVTAQVAIAFVLLIGAGLLLASFNNLLAVDPGFRPEHVLTGRVSLLETKYPDDARVRGYAGRALERIRALPGVVAAGATSYLPFSWDSSSSVIIPEGYVMAPGESVVSPNQLYVTPGYLEAMRVALKHGRLFVDSDTETAPHVVIIDEQLAKRFWPTDNPIGRRMYTPRRPEELEKPAQDTPSMQVVGVVGAVKLRGLVEGEGARIGAYYLPIAQHPVRGLAFAIRTTGSPTDLTAGIRRVLAQIDPEAPMFDVFTMSDRVRQSLNPRRAPLMLALGFGAVALLLASLGIYGVLAYQVTQRTREIGIRMALGCERAGIIRLVLREGGLLVAVGLAIGLIGAVAMRTVITTQLYGVNALEPIVIAAVIGVLGVAALAACLGPARRASRVSPVVALTEH